MRRCTLYSSAICGAAHEASEEYAGASISDVYLGGFNVAAIKHPSHLSIVSMNATLSAGRLQALFQIRLNGSAKALANAATPYIYAVGMLDSSGVIEQHADTQVLAMAALLYNCNWINCPIHVRE